LTKARTLHTRVTELVGEPTQPIACASWLGLARIAYQRNDLANARVWADRGIELAETIEGIDVPVEGAVLLARIAYAEGAREQADAALEEARTRAREHGYAVQLREVARLRAHRLALSGGIPDARNLVAEARLTAIDEARVELAAGDDGAARALLEPALKSRATDETAGPTLLMAMALVGSGRADEATDSVAGLLSALRAEDNVRLIADEGPAVVPLLEECVRAGIEPVFATRVLAVLDAASPQAAVAAQRDEVGLSRRELEVLRLLAGGLSNREIAERLFVSLSTVKGHATRIYEKLGANRRTDAVARARERGLV
jgi:LuxR family maltose regulon positive regulatory protein